VVHGIPDERIIKDGDIVSLDLGIKWQGLFTDAAVSRIAGRGDVAAQKLLEATEKALLGGIRAIRAGRRLGDIGWTIQSYLESQGFGVVRELVGHGLGHSPHEDPDVPNWGKKGTGRILEEGLVIALEPMATEGLPDVILDKNGWVWKTQDGSRSAHFEHSVVVTRKGALVLTNKLGVI
jgi:methionyl aminopeptidase